jgi:hypothetical protein
MAKRFEFSPDGRASGREQSDDRQLSLAGSRAKPHSPAIILVFHIRR